MLSLESYFFTYKVLKVYDGTFSEAETTGGTKLSSSSCQCCLMNCFSKTAARWQVVKEKQETKANSTHEKGN
jgi:hypothetical protein